MIEQRPSVPRDSNAYVAYVIGLLVLVNLFNYMDRMALAVLLPSIKAELTLSDGQLGLLVGFAFSIFYAVCGLPIARWADRGIRRNIIALALATWSVMTALCGAAQNYGQLFAARVGVGAGEAGGLAPAQSMLCDYVPVHRRPGVFALHGFGVFLGMMLGMAFAGHLGEVIGWRATFVALGLPGIVLAIIVRLTLREPTRGAFDAGESGADSGASLRSTLLVLWRCRTLRRLTVFLVLNGFFQFGLNQWWPSYYTRVLGLGMASVGTYLGIAIGIGSGVGLLLGGLLANRLARRNPRAPLWLCALANAMAVPVALGSLWAPSLWGAMGFVLLTALCWSVAGGPVLAALFSVTRPAMRATAGALTIFFISVLGFGLGPFCVGALSDVLAPSLGIESLRYALLAPVAMLPLMVVALYAAARTLPDDLRAVGVQTQNAMPTPRDEYEREYAR